MALWRRFVTRVLTPAGLAIGIIVIPLPGKRPGPFTFRDDFSRYAPGSDASPRWFSQTAGWSVRDGAYHCSDPSRSFALIERAPFGLKVTVEATVRVTGTTTDTWKVAGVAIYANDRNYWHLALGEAPDADGARHFVELTEMLDGVWLAQSQPRTRLTAAEDFRSDPWKRGEPYRLRLTLGRDGITGTVSDAAGQVIARSGYKFDHRAVIYGRPALDSGGFAAAFDDASARVEEEVALPETKFPAYRDPQGRAPLAKAPGFFKVTQRGDRWWFLDPNGREFFALGTDHVNWNVHWCEKLGYAPYNRNLVAKYGGDEARWARTTQRRLQSWGFNLLGANSSPSLHHQGLAHTDFVSMGQGFASLDALVAQVHWTGFPDVFSDKWPVFCDKTARRVCEPQKDDPWLVGYFMDNELEWYGKSGREDGLADEAFKKPRDYPAKQALMALLRERYRTIEGFNAAWGVAFADFDALAAVTEPVKSETDAARRDKRDFVRLAAERYFREAAAAIRRHDPNHLVLGCRFAGQAPEVWDIAGKYCDVVSVNAYRQVDLDTGVVIGFEKDLREWHAKARRPMMLTEWSFPALDSGLPCKHGAGQRFDTQAQRARAFEIFETLLLRTPFLVGSDYFMWVDEPALGISSTFPEDSNYGLVNEHDLPYPELTETARRVHAQWRQLHEEGPAPPPKEPEAPAYTPGAAWTRDDAPERLPLLLWSAAATGDEPAPVAAKLRDLWPAADPADIAARALAVTDESGAAVPFQMDKLPDGPEIALRAPQAPRTLFLYLSAGPVERRASSVLSPIHEASSILGGRLGWRITTGRLVVTSSSREDSAEAMVGIALTGNVPREPGTQLGSLSALLWQQDAQGNHWEDKNTVRPANASGGPVRAVLDFITTHAGDSLSYRAAYRITAWEGEAWVASQCLWIENTASKPWTLERYYHYARSNIGGDASDDVVGGPGVPSYYLPFAVWTDPKLDISYGALSPRLGDFDTYFWKDDNGGEHADFSRQVGVTLQPGERFDAPQPEGVIFAARGSAREAAAAIARQVRAALAVRLKGLPAERR